MNWFKKFAQYQLGLYGDDAIKEKVPKETDNPDIHIWGLGPAGRLSIAINKRLYIYDNVIPYEETQLQALLNHKNYKKFFSILREISDRKEPFKRSLPYAK